MAGFKDTAAIFAAVRRYQTESHNLHLNIAFQEFLKESELARNLLFKKLRTLMFPNDTRTEV